MHSLHMALSKEFSGKKLLLFIFHVKLQPLSLFLTLSSSLAFS